MTTPAGEILRDDLLEGVSVLVADLSTSSTDSDGSLGASVGQACTRLRASVSHCRPLADRLPAGSEEAAVEESVNAALVGVPCLDLLVVDCARVPIEDRPAHPAAAQGAREALRVCLGTAWSVTRAVVHAAFLPPAGGGRIVYLAPASGVEQAETAQHADAARAGLENLSRTLSIEWARHAITAVTIAPGVATSAEDVATLTAYVASPAGAYFSGCLLDLRGPRAPAGGRASPSRSV